VAAVRREDVALAFIAALQTLPPRQRAVLILRDVLDFRARETADLLDLTIPAVTSALHRARISLARAQGAGGARSSADAAMSERQRILLDRYVRAWQSANVQELIALLKEEVTLAMPPSSAWYVGRDAVGTFVGSWVFDGAGSGRWRLVPTRANGGPAFGLYRLDPPGGHVPFGIQTIAFEGERVSEITTFIIPGLFRLFALPGTPPA
jgi:RNA polymerase sigma-70 factor (ECF subfamily)